MPSVFISHSKGDVHLRKFFSEIFSGLELRAQFIEFEELSGKYAGHEISRMIRAGLLSGHDTAAVFVLLGDSLERPATNTPEFTHNWVAFEVGAAASCLKPVWVFEEYDKFIRFPIPYVTDYAQYRLDDISHLKYFRSVFKEYILYPSRVKTVKPVDTIKCPYADCNANYVRWSSNNTINCPVCRRSMLINNK